MGRKRPAGKRRRFDVCDTGLSLSEAARLAKRRRQRGPDHRLRLQALVDRRAIEPDVVAWKAPGRFLVGYGMDAAGAMRGLPFIGAMD